MGEWFAFDFAVHEVSVADKGDAVLSSIWFHLEQVKL